MPDQYETAPMANGSHGVPAILQPNRQAGHLSVMTGQSSLASPAVLPKWFDATFRHLVPEERAIAERLWREEPTLQLLALLLESLWPENTKLRACPRCANRRISWSLGSGDHPKGLCSACRSEFSASEGTPFYRLPRTSWRRLFGVLVVLWGPWTPFFAWRIAGCSDTKQFADYRRRLAPLFDELAEGTPLTSRPAYRLGFTPAQQGVRCPHCNSADLRYRRRRDADNPDFACLACGKDTALKASRRQGLPLPDAAVCPSCGGRNLKRAARAETQGGRQSYRCRDCKRQFIEAPRKFQPSAAQPTRPVPPEVRCPSCGGADIHLHMHGRDGRAIYRCKTCKRQFLERPKREPTRLRYGPLSETNDST